MASSLLTLFDEVDAELSSAPHYALGDLSRILRVERHAIQESVREANGASFREYRKSKLLEKSIKLLTGDRDLPIKQVALILGFRHPSNFSRFISKATGKTPSEIRDG